jgi:hypothetical protein
MTNEASAKHAKILNLLNDIRVAGGGEPLSDQQREELVAEFEENAARSAADEVRGMHNPDAAGYLQATRKHLDDLYVATQNRPTSVSNDPNFRLLLNAVQGLYEALQALNRA